MRISDIMAESQRQFLTRSDEYVRDQIRWKDTEIDRYRDDQITHYYEINLYGRKTRWELWNKVVESCKRHNIKTICDMGCANGHFQFLCLANDIDAYGIDPRTYNWVDKVFDENYGKKYIYQSTISSFTEVVKNSDVNITFDCLTCLNWLHGLNHRRGEIIELFYFIKKHAKYIICTEPRWDDLGMDNMFRDFDIVEDFKTEFTFLDIIKSRSFRCFYYLIRKPATHHLYKVR